MIRSSKHNITNITNKGKLAYLDQLFIDYKHDLILYINYIIDGVLPLKQNLSSALLPTENIKHSRYKQLIYKQASSIIRSQLDKAKKKRYNVYKKIYTYYCKYHPNSTFTNIKFSELSLKNILKSKYFTIPSLNNISINLDERFFNITEGTHFDNFINLKLPYFNDKGTRALQINIPLKQHKQSNKLKSNNFNLVNNIQLKIVNNEYYICLIWDKPNVKMRENGNTVGIDMGYNKLIVTSDNQFIGSDMKELYQKISNKKQGSKAFNKLLTHRDNMINFHVNNMKIDNVKTIVVEELLNVKHKSKLNTKINNKIQRWSYRKTTSKLERISEEHGIELVKVSPTYTSQGCSKCGAIHKESRQGEIYKCIDCLYEIDADLNASINIKNRGVYSLSDH